MTTLWETLREAQWRLQSRGIPDARLEAELLLMAAAAASRAQLYARSTDPLSLQERSSAEVLLERRLRREPASYILGQKEFYGLDYWVAPGVFIPRPETELLVEQVIRLAPLRPTNDQWTAVDVGTGTGAIAVALAVHLSHIRVFATDISPEAVRVATLNRDLHGVTERVVPLQGDLLAPLPQSVDLIVANLPYIPSGEIASLEPEVRLYEPREALDGGLQGVDVIQRLLQQAPAKLSPGGALILEVDPRQASRVQELAKAAFPQATVSTARDLTHRERAVIVDLLGTG